MAVTDASQFLALLDSPTDPLVWFSQNATC